MRATNREVLTSSPEQTIAFGRELATELRPPALVLLQGELGAGKTTLAKGIVAGLGAAAEDEVNSPTFVLVQEYGAGKVQHVDLYRIDSLADLESLGLDDLLAGNTIVLVEWPERLESSGVSPTWVVRLERAGEEVRKIQVEYPAG